MKKFLTIFFIAVIALSFACPVYADRVQNQKEQFAVDMRALSQQIMDLRQTVDALQAKYFSLEFNSGAANVIIDADYDNTEFSGAGIATIMANIITSYQSFETWIDAGHDDQFTKILK